MELGCQTLEEMYIINIGLASLDKKWKLCMQNFILLEWLKQVTSVLGSCVWVRQFLLPLFLP